METVYTPDSLRNLFQSSFNLAHWYSFLQHFLNATGLKSAPERIIENTYYYLGNIDTTDSYRIGLFQYNITKGSVANKRVGLRNLVKSFVNPTWGEFDAALVVFDSGDHWRLSFICDIKGEATSPKRYTYVFGSGDLLYKTPVERFSLLKKREISFDSLKEAFSVEALSKEFFDKYRQHYADFVAYITGKRYVKSTKGWIEKQTHEAHPQLQEQFLGDEKRVRDYIKKLLGRIVFLHYLQRKGWLGVPVGKSWGEGDPDFMRHLFEYASEEQKADFVGVVLEPLFYGALNTDRSKKGDLFDTQVQFPNVGTSLRIPYLNGGLFEADENDELTVQFPAEYFKNLLDFFSQYNFTVDENDPSDAQVGVDPEMLGRIFESLLEDNKEKGAYYTPKEIVQYMCRESLIAYLSTDLDKETDKTTYQAIINFVRSNNAENLRFTTEQNEEIDLRTEILNKITEVKICDPAIGSGAFPMGLLRELYHCRIALEEQTVSAAEIKSQIIKNNIYGVDIERGAVDIARLRFWLSLVVDEDTPQPLPNLDYKIMQGNSLLESYKGIDLSFLTQKKEIKVGDSVAGLFEDTVDVYRRELRQAVSNYYGETDHTLKEGLHQKMKEAVQLLFTEQGYEINLTGINLSANPHFFLWHTWFDDVFNRPSGDNGFDIVIGNPPYLRIQGIRMVDPVLANALVELYESATASFDLYVVFIELGLSLTTNNGVVNYIAPTKWSNASFGKGLRRLLHQQSAASSIIDFGDFQVFNASTYSGIQTFRRGARQLLFHQLNQNLSVATEIETYLNSLESSDFSRIDYLHFGENPWVLTTGKISKILSKLRQQPLTLGDVFEKIYQGIATSKDDVYFLYDVTDISKTVIEGFSKQVNQRIQIEKALVKPLLKGEDIHRYDDIKTDRCVIFPYKLEKTGVTLYEEKIIAELFPLGYKYLKSYEEVLRGRENGRLNTDNYWYRYIYPKNLMLYQCEKLVAPEISLGGNFAYDRKGHFYHTTTVYGYIKKDNIEISYETLMAILNSQICWWYLSNTGTVLANGYSRYKPAYLKGFPIPLISSRMDEKIQDILKNEGGDSVSLEAVLNSLYRLTEEDIAVIYESVD